MALTQDKSIGEISDGYHTFNELYEHRFALWEALCRVLVKVHHRCDDVAWRSRRHSDGTNYPGWFLLGLFYDLGEQITYHLPDKEWGNCDFAQELDLAPKFDGHSSADVLHRLGKL